LKYNTAKKSDFKTIRDKVPFLNPLSSKRRPKFFAPKNENATYYRVADPRKKQLLKKRRCTNQIQFGSIFAGIQLPEPECEWPTPIAMNTY